jgi:poly(3-hydroxybutyrate) depolymerase
MQSTFLRQSLSLPRLAWLFFLVPPCAATAGDYVFSDDFSDPGPGPTRSCSFTPDADGFFTLASTKSNYVVRLPPAYEVAHPRPSRLLVALHGCGDTAANFATWAAVPYSLRSTQSYIAISVGGRDGTCWNNTADAPIVAAAIADVRSCFYVHQERIVLAGYSSGGDLAYRLGMTDALVYAGLLIEHASLSSAVGSGNVTSVLNAAGWKLNVGHIAGINDESYPIATVKSDIMKMTDAGFPVQYQETNSTHDGTSSDWSGYLLPLMTKWSTP